MFKLGSKCHCLPNCWSLNIYFDAFQCTQRLHNKCSWDILINTQNAPCSLQLSLCAQSLSIIILRSVSILRVPASQTRSHILAAWSFYQQATGLPVLKIHILTELWIAGTVSRAKFALVTIYTHLGVVLRGIWADLVIFSLSMEMPHLVDLSHCTWIFCIFNCI